MKSNVPKYPIINTTIIVLTLLGMACFALFAIILLFIIDKLYHSQMEHIVVFLKVATGLFLSGWAFLFVAEILDALVRLVWNSYKWSNGNGS